MKSSFGFRYPVEDQDKVEFYFMECHPDMEERYIRFNCEGVLYMVFGPVSHGRAITLIKDTHSVHTTTSSCNSYFLRAL